MDRTYVSLDQYPELLEVPWNSITWTPENNHTNHRFVAPPQAYSGMLRMIWKYYFDGFRDGLVEPSKDVVKEVWRIFRPGSFSSDYAEQKIKKVTEDKVIKQTVLIYDIFKKGHRMVTW